MKTLDESDGVQKLKELPRMSKGRQRELEIALVE